MGLGDMMNQGKWALVTGASSGIGKELAIELAKKGMNLVLIARREPLLKQLQSDLQSYNIESEVLPIDLTSQKSADQIKNWLIQKDIRPFVLVNNAGRGLYGHFLNQSSAEIEQVMQLNMHALTLMCREIIPYMQQGGHVLLVSSTIAYIPVPQYSVYAATKSYVHSFGYALADDLKPNINVTILYPGVTDTAFFEVSHHKMANWLKKVLTYQPSFVAQVGVKAMLQKKTRVMPGILNQILTYSSLVTPDYITRLMLKNIFNLGGE
jgi:short-subunit dehydrogenase